MITLLLATVLALQTPQAPQAPQAEWRSVDGILLIINDDSITKRGFLAQRAKFMANTPGTTLERANKALQEEIVNNTVGSQAGEAMGVDVNMVRRVVRDHERRVIESKGGVDQYSLYLLKEGLTAEGVRAELEKQVFRDMWEDARVGKGPNQEQKLIADRFVRPGMLRLTYAQIAQNPRSVSLIGGSSSKVVLQVLQVDPVKVGGTAQAEKNAGAIRARIASGASDFDLESSYAVTGTRSGKTEPLDEAGLAATDPQLFKVVASAREGELLPLLPPHDSTLYWRIVRLVGRVPAEVPGFKAASLQETIRKLIEGALDTSRIAHARQQQLESSFIWSSAAAER